MRTAGVDAVADTTTWTARHRTQPLGSLAHWDPCVGGGHAHGHWGGVCRCTCMFVSEGISSRKHSQASWNRASELLGPTGLGRGRPAMLSALGALLDQRLGWWLFISFVCSEVLMRPLAAGAFLVMVARVLCSRCRAHSPRTVPSGSPCLPLSLPVPMLECGGDARGPVSHCQAWTPVWS